MTQSGHPRQNVNSHTAWLETSGGKHMARHNHYHKGTAAPLLPLGSLPNAARTLPPAPLPPPPTKQHTGSCPPPPSTHTHRQMSPTHTDTQAAAPYKHTHTHTLTLLIRHPAAQVLLQVCVLVIVDAHKLVTRLSSQVANKTGLATAGGALVGAKQTQQAEQAQQNTAQHRQTTAASSAPTSTGVGRGVFTHADGVCVCECVCVCCCVRSWCSSGRGAWGACQPRRVRCWVLLCSAAMLCRPAGGRPAHMPRAAEVQECVAA